MKTMTLAVPTVGATPRPGAGLSWQPSSAPTARYALGTGLPGVGGVDGTAAAHVALAAPVARAAASVDLAALPFVAPMFGAAAASTQATTVQAVAGATKVAVAPKQAKTRKTSNTLVNFMRENATPRGDRAGAPPS